MWCIVAFYHLKLSCQIVNYYVSFIQKEIANLES
jgi:hypothetical protein